METAARDRQIAAVVAQVPFADGLRNLPSLGVALALRLVAAGLRDQIGDAPAGHRTWRRVLRPARLGGGDDHAGR